MNNYTIENKMNNCPFNVFLSIKDNFSFNVLWAICPCLFCSIAAMRFFYLLNVHLAFRGLTLAFIIYAICCFCFFKTSIIATFVFECTALTISGGCCICCSAREFIEHGRFLHIFFAEILLYVIVLFVSAVLNWRYGKKHPTPEPIPRKKMLVYIVIFIAIISLGVVSSRLFLRNFTENAILVFFGGGLLFIGLVLGVGLGRIIPRFVAWKITGGEEKT